MYQASQKLSLGLVGGLPQSAIEAFKYAVFATFASIHAKKNALRALNHSAAIVNHLNVLIGHHTMLPLSELSFPHHPTTAMSSVRSASGISKTVKPRTTPNDVDKQSAAAATIVPDELALFLYRPIFPVCDAYLKAAIDMLQPKTCSRTSSNATLDSLDCSADTVAHPAEAVDLNALSSVITKYRPRTRTAPTIVPPPMGTLNGSRDGASYAYGDPDGRIAATRTRSRKRCHSDIGPMTVQAALAYARSDWGTVTFNVLNASKNRTDKFNPNFAANPWFGSSSNVKAYAPATTAVTSSHTTFDQDAYNDDSR